MFYEIDEFFLLDMCSINLYFALELLIKAKLATERLLELQKDAPNAKSSSKVAEHIRDRRI